MLSDVDKKSPPTWDKYAWEEAAAERGENSDRRFLAAMGFLGFLRRKMGRRRNGDGHLAVVWVRATDLRQETRLSKDAYASMIGYLEDKHVVIPISDGRPGKSYLLVGSYPGDDRPTALARALDSITGDTRVPGYVRRALERELMAAENLEEASEEEPEQPEEEPAEDPSPAPVESPQVELPTLPEASSEVRKSDFPSSIGHVTDEDWTRGSAATESVAAEKYDPMPLPSPTTIGLDDERQRRALQAFLVELASTYGLSWNARQCRAVAASCVAVVGDGPHVRQWIIEKVRAKLAGGTSDNRIAEYLALDVAEECPRPHGETYASDSDGEAEPDVDPQPEQPEPVAPARPRSPTQNRAREVWNAACEALRQRLSDRTFTQWFLGVEPIAISDGALILEVCDEFCQIWIEDRYNDDIAWAIAQLRSDVVNRHEICVRGEDATVYVLDVASAAAYEGRS